MAIHHHPCFLIFIISQFLLPWTNSYPLSPLYSSYWPHSLYLLPTPYHFNMYMYGILLTLFLQNISVNINIYKVSEPRKAIISTMHSVNT